jgi:methylenetetrahydrofolate reductase (NADH)
MPREKTLLQERIESERPLRLFEISPPAGTDPAPLRAIAKWAKGKVHAVGVSDNRDRVSMSALAAAAVLVSEGVEPILHVTTRDRNRIALVSDCLGAQALGIRNVLCTSGTHQTLGPFRAARNVFDLDSIQLLQAYADLATNGSLVGEKGFDESGPLCLGGVAAPYADPLEMQVLRMAKKAAAGAQFLVTQPIFDLERFDLWWKEVTRRGLHEQVAIVASVEPLTCLEKAKELAAKRPSPRIPAALVDRLAKASPSDQRAAGIRIALETLERLSKVDGLRGFGVAADGDPEAAFEVLDHSNAGAD